MALNIYYFSNFLFPFIIYSSTLRIPSLNIRSLTSTSIKRLCQFDNNGLSLKSCALVAFN